MNMSEQPHRKLIKCHVLFLGDSTPKHTNRGLQSLQEPLMRCYPVDNPYQVEGIDSWLTIFTSGILLQYVGTKHDQPTPIWFPIQNLQLAAATKCINYLDRYTGQRMETEFLDINNSAAKHSSHPPLFSIVVRKSSDPSTLRCYTFLVRDEKPAVMMVEAASHAFDDQSGWSNTHPPDDILYNELVSGADDADDVDQFDSISAAGRNAHINASDSELQSDPNRMRSFPAHLVKKYTLTNTNRGLGEFSTNSARRPIPAQFMRGGASLKSTTGGVRVGHPPIPPQMINGSGRIPAHIAGSMRTTSTVRVLKDPQTRTSVIEKVIREPVPVAVPVYQPPAPPRVIHQVKPIYIPQPPEIRHVPVDREIPIPVEVPVPYPVENPEFYDAQSHNRPHYKSRSSKNHTFKNYKVFDDGFSRKDSDRSAFMRSPDRAYNFDAPQSYTFGAPEEYLHSNVYRKQQRSNRRRRSRGSSSEDSEDDVRGRPTWEYNPYNRHGGIEIIELNSPDEQSRPEGRSRREEHSKEYHISELVNDTNGLNIREGSRNSVAGPEEFKWSAMPSAFPEKDREERKAERRKRAERKAAEKPPSPSHNQSGQVYIGADAVNGAKTNLEPKPSSFHVFQAQGDTVIQELKSKQGKKKDKSSKSVEQYPDYQEASTSKEYYFKEQTENPPRNWMDEKKEYMNERAFSSSLANDPGNQMTNAYALNREPEDDTMLDRAMPGPPLHISGGIPPAPPLPANWQGADGNPAGLY